MPRSILTLNGWTDADFYANPELRLEYKTWLSSVRGLPSTEAGSSCAQERRWSFQNPLIDA